MLNSKLLLIKNEFIKLNADSLLLGVFINLKDLLITCIPTLKFWFNTIITKHISIAAIDKFTLVVFTYFMSLMTTSFAFAQMHYEKHEAAINSLISKSLYFLTGDTEIANSNILLIIIQLAILGMVINLIIAIIFRKRMRKRQTSSFYQQFDYESFYNYEQYDRYDRSEQAQIENQNPIIDDLDYAHKVKIHKLALALLYLHNIRVINLAQISALLLDPSLLALQLGIPGLQRLDLQEQMLKSLETLSKNNMLDKNMRNLSDFLILTSPAHPLQDALLTAKMLDNIIKIMPDFKQFINQANLVINDLKSLSEHLNHYITHELKTMQNNFDKLVDLFKGEMIKDPLTTLLNDVKTFSNRMSQLYESFTTPFANMKAPDLQDINPMKHLPAPEQLMEPISYLKAEASKCIDSCHELSTNITNEIKNSIKSEISAIENITGLNR